jgi:hypothetical protein
MVAVRGGNCLYRAGSGMPAKHARAATRECQREAIGRFEKR